MGVVYAGRHHELGRVAAVKLLLPQAENTPQARERFQLECEALGRLDHPGIVRVYESGFHEGRPFVALEFIEGEPLDEVLKRGPLEVEAAIQIGIGICEAVEHAHQAGILHRDLKPANVLLDTLGRPRVTDFGLAKDVNAESLTVSGTMLGTPAFMPPEQAAGDKSLVGATLDVYGLGATLFALLTGEAPFRGPTAINIVTQVYLKPAPVPSSLRSDLDTGIDALLLRCLEKDPAERFASVFELGEALRRYLGGERLEGRRRRRPLAFALAGLLFVGLLGGGAALSFSAKPTPTPTPTPSLSAAELRKRAATALRRARTLDEVRAWILTESKHASAKTLERAQSRLAELTWKALPSSEVGSNANPDAGDLRRLKRYWAVQAWAKEHLTRVGKPIARQARIELDHLAKPARVLALLRNKPMGMNSQDAAFLPSGHLLVYGGESTNLRSYDLIGATRAKADSPLEPFVRDQTLLEGNKKLRGVRVDPQSAWILAPLGLALLQDEPPLLRLPYTRDAKVMVQTEDHLLVGGSRRDSEGGFLLMVSKADLRKGRGELAQCSEVPFSRPVASLALHPKGKWVYVGGGPNDADDGDGILVQVSLAGGRLKRGATMLLGAMGKRVAVSPTGTHVLVGLNRGGFRVFGLDEEGVSDKSRELNPLISLPREDESIGNADVQSQGFLFLPNGDLLYSCDLYNDIEEKRGFLSLYQPDALVVRSGTGREASENERIGPVWSTLLPYQARHLALSPDGSLLAIGSKGGAVILIPWRTSAD